MEKLDLDMILFKRKSKYGNIAALKVQREKRRVAELNEKAKDLLMPEKTLTEKKIELQELADKPKLA